MAFTKAWISECLRILKPAGSIYVSCAYHNIAEVMSSLRELGLKINNVITWHKSNAMPNMTRRVFTHCTEFVVWAVRGSGWTFNYEELKEIAPHVASSQRLTATMAEQGIGIPTTTSRESTG